MSNTKQKMKHLPINLFLCLDSFGVTFLALTLIQDNKILSFVFGLIVYMNNVKTDSQIDYLNEQIENLKKQN